ncbi:MAG TPA: hypothetical protein VFO86_02315 [Terriglobia bacterium]|nr:hypothetical protein [Terriglobia bacterium]
MIEATLIPIILGGIILLTPIVWILTRHQQKMTQMMHEGNLRQAGVADASLQRELAAIREVLNQQTIALDNLSKAQAELKASMSSEELAQRIG